jgi:hypothetical protein
MKDLEYVGTVDVDSGLTWIGDPCYIIHKKKKDIPRTLGKNWEEFCSKLRPEYTPFGHSKINTEGLGMAIQSGYGDGTYPVYVRRDDEGVIIEIRVRFDE